MSDWVAMDKIYIRDLAVRCIIGIFPEERHAKQEVLINICMETDLQAAGRSDDLNDTVDYKRLKKMTLAMVEQSRFQLIESLAEKTAEICLSDEKVQRVTVTVDKPGALRFARSAAVEVVRIRS
jgi:dihydroneopterin aldolase/D-erythro-7,8-dihydroneopterin triphosphate epimerase